jgi:ATP-dependent protease ClpP protease subunit
MIRVAVIAAAFEAATLLSWIPPAAFAMDYRLAGDKLFASGEIVQGDAQRLALAIASAPKDTTTDAPSVTVVLDSLGGDLFEGMRIGEAIRTAGVPTLVQRSHICASACALAFLGGMTKGAASDAVWRSIEPGAQLAFHGFRLSGNAVRLENETLDIGRVANAIVLEYARRMGDVDLGEMARLLDVAPEKVEVINTPREISSLGIRLSGDPPKPRLGGECLQVHCRKQIVAARRPTACELTSSNTALKLSFLPAPGENLSSPMTGTPIANETSSSACSPGSRTSGASPRATTSSRETS